MTAFKIGFLALLIVISSVDLANAQMRIFVTKDREKAEVLVYKTRFFSEASLVVKKTWSVSDADKPFHWYFVSGNMASMADWVVYYVDSFEEADVTVLFTENPKLFGQYSVCQKMDDLVKKHYESKKGL